MIDGIFAHIPGVTIILSTIAKSRDHSACADNVSQQFRDLITSYPSNTKLMLADFNAAMSYDQLGPDGIHPTDSGYELFAAVWWDAIRKMQSTITAPNQVAGLDDSKQSAPSTCKKVGTPLFAIDATLTN
jgi:hypothetical protein